MQMQQLSMTEFTKLQRQVEAADTKHAALTKELAALKVGSGNTNTVWHTRLVECFAGPPHDTAADRGGPRGSPPRSAAVS